MSVSNTRQPVPPFTETRSPVPLLYRRHSSGEIRNLASISSSLLPAFGTVVESDESLFFLFLPFPNHHCTAADHRLLLFVFINKLARNSSTDGRMFSPCHTSAPGGTLKK
ncbi:Potassium channel NtKC1 [Abeliophyllum distichum]|uniref:Potassium channel NtKC1 n=1 Tax=Abeliophyllum distichum TaxID=126358 RepID=A0ABD1SU35_9LAMI